MLLPPAKKYIFSIYSLYNKAAHAAAHSKNRYLSAFYHCVKARGGGKPALIAVGHTILVAIYHMLSRNLSYQELGGNYFYEHDWQAVEKRLVRCLKKLGYQVSLEYVAQVAS
jgi:transposase